MNRMVSREQQSAPAARSGFAGDDFDRVFEGFFRPLRWLEEAGTETLAPPIDISERENEFVVRTDLPGVKKQDINVTLENGVLTISAEYKKEDEQKQGDRVIRQERRAGRFVRSLRLGVPIDEKQIKASYKDGVLELLLPKAEEAKPKKINVDVA